MLRTRGLMVALDATKEKLTVWNGTRKLLERSVPTVRDPYTERHNCSDHSPHWMAAWLQGPWLLIDVAFEPQDGCPTNPADLWIGPVRVGAVRPAPASQPTPRGPAP